MIPSSDKDSDWLFDEFLGKPFSKKWKRLELVISMPLLPRPDFFDFGPNCFVCNQRAADILEEALTMSGELLPVKVKGESGTHYICNITNCIEVLDEKRSKWQMEDGYKYLKRPSFHPGRVGEIPLFKIPDDGGMNIYCMERTKDPLDIEFKALVDSHELTGLEFNLVQTIKKDSY